MRGILNMNFDTDIKCLYGVGPKKAELFNKMGIFTLGDLCYHFPRAYENRGNVIKVEDAQDGQISSFIIKMVTDPYIVVRNKKMTLAKMVGHDDTGKLTLVFYNNPYIKDSIHINGTYRVYGKVKRVRDNSEMVNPVYELVNPIKELMPFVPVYPLTQGINQKFMMSTIKLALDTVLSANISGVVDYIPYEVKKENNLADISYALQKIHFPNDYDEVKRARKRLAFDEVYLFSIRSMLTGNKEKNVPGAIYDISSSTKFLQSLPYKPTNAQTRTMREIATDLKSGRRMSRLVTGDVGSGKTLCAAFALFLALENGQKSVLMAPTEILARQHFISLSKMFEGFGYECLLLVGATPAAQKRKILQRLLQDEPVLVIGTHALIEDSVSVNNLGLIVIDEQHRFGANQRDKLRNKSKSCHLISMSATPIPRTLALVLYGDLDISTIDEMPPGRQVVDTYYVNEDYRERIDNFILKNVKEGGQVYIVCPSVEEEETIECEGGYSISLDMLEQFLDYKEKPKLKAAVNYSEELSRRFPELKVGFIHGKLKSKDKEKIMEQFVKGDLDILVSTTVIEVGVNVPNASLMIIENAEFFGLSGLHQLRGRVGRGDRKSYCILVSDTKNPNTMERLNILKNNHDGYMIWNIAVQEILLPSLERKVGKVVMQI
ncbi:MAG: ATP-dependent DNA helicase RecG [Clostridia bacterium]|nr:ATP-dependent DNA helicase RecG [Clostridia bacterium]